MKDYSVMNEAANIASNECDTEKATILICKEAAQIMYRVQSILRDYHPYDRPLVLAAISHFVEIILAAPPGDEVDLCHKIALLFKDVIGCTTTEIPMPPPTNPIVEKEDEDNEKD